MEKKKKKEIEVIEPISEKEDKESFDGHREKETKKIQINSLKELGISAFVCIPAKKLGRTRLLADRQPFYKVIS